MSGSKITKISIDHEFAPSGHLNYLHANTMEKVFIKLEMEFSERVLASTDNPITVNYTDGVLGDGWIYDPAGRFGNFEIGDSIIVGNYVTEIVLDASRTIVDKVGTTLIQLDANVTGRPDDDVSIQDIFSVSTPITALKYQWNFIENSEALNFTSKIDGSTHLAVKEDADGSDITVVPMTPIGPHEYQIGGITMQGALIFDDYYYATKFNIVHETYLTPFMRAYLDGVDKPTYFQLLKCLKYVCKVQGLYDYSDPNRVQEIISSDVLGNSGWFDENFNTDAEKYSIESVVYKKADNTTVIPSLELTTNDQYVEVTINSTDGTFVNNNTEFTLNIIKVPYDSIEYIGNGRYAAINFCFDRKLHVVGLGAVNGDQWGGVNQSLKQITGEYISATQIKVKFRVKYAPEVLAIIQESEIPHFLIAINVADYTLPANTTDRVQLKIGPSEYYIDTSDPDMIGITNKYLRHYENDPVLEGIESISVMPNDEVVAYSQFYIDKNGRESDEIKLKTVQLKIVLRNSLTLEEFELDSYTEDLSTIPLAYGGLPQYVDVNVSRGFHIPSTEPRRQVRIKRRSDLDDSGLYYYDLYFPFFVGWEYFKPATVSAFFFNPSSPNNGQNQYWKHYQGGNWAVYYELDIVATKNGILQEYVFRNQLDLHDWNSAAKWDPETIKTYDPDTLAELYDSGTGKRYILGYKNTLVKCSFHNSAPQDLSKLQMAVHIGKWETDDRTGVRRFSTIQVMTTDTWFKSVDSSNLIQESLTGGGNTYVGTFLIDYTKIPVFDSFAIYARVYEVEPDEVDTFYLLTESSEIIQQEDGNLTILE